MNKFSNSKATALLRLTVLYLKSLSPLTISSSNQTLKIKLTSPRAHICTPVYLSEVIYTTYFAVMYQITSPNLAGLLRADTTRTLINTCKLLISLIS